MIILSTLLFTFLMSSCMIYFFLKIRNQQQMGPNNNGGIMLPGMELSDAGGGGGGYYSTAGKQIGEEEYESIDYLDEHRYAPYHDIQNDQQHQQSLNEEQQSISDYYERMNPNVIRSHSNSSAPIVLDSYYDDSNVRPSYLAMRRKV